MTYLHGIPKGDLLRTLVVPYSSWKGSIINVIMTCMNCLRLAHEIRSLQTHNGLAGFHPVGGGGGEGQGGSSPPEILTLI